MPHADCVHLRVHTAYSLLEGAMQIERLVQMCCEHQMPAVAITDTGNMFGALEFSEECARSGVQPIIGSAIGVDFMPDEVNGSDASRQRDSGHLVLLAKDRIGYQNLMSLSSHSFMDTEVGISPRVSIEKLRTCSAGLIALTGGPRGIIGIPILENQLNVAERFLSDLQSIFADRLYIEIQRHGMQDEINSEAAFLHMAYSRDIPLVATNEVYFPDESMYEAHDALLCIEQRTTLSAPERSRMTPEHRFKSAPEMRQVFNDLPEALDNTNVIAQRCAYRPRSHEPILPAYQAVSGRSPEDELRALAREGLKARLKSDNATNPTVKYDERLEFELDVIVSMGYAGYFLIVADFIRFAREADIPVGPGRGSGAGSLVAWALRITSLDPLRFGLLFERFLNPDRISMPDFDIDFCQERRDEVIRYVQCKYGREKVAQIITFGTLQARAALRDVGRVLELPYGHVDRICKMVPYNPANPITLSEAVDAEPRLSQERDEDPDVGRMLKIASKLEGLYRHASTHAAGVVIGDRPIDELVPLYLDPRSGMPATQFSMKFVEMAGLIKFDFLGLKTLTVIDYARRMLEKQRISVDIENLALDDTATYEMLQRGETVGVFQFESSGMRDLIREAIPTNIEDLIALVALYRPGPMENIPKYVACKHGREDPEHLHDTISPVVSDTYGVIIYQEQVMQIAQVFAGFSLAQADLLRRAMGKKIKSEMAAQRESFVEGAIARSVSRERAAHVFDLVDKFAGYGFNKAHSAGYALIAYQTAWLKANYPVQFLAASMSLDIGNTDKLDIFRREAIRLGIEIKPPDINHSGVLFTVEMSTANEGSSNPPNASIRYALAAIRNVGEQAMAGIVEERKKNGPFKDLFDFAHRFDSSSVNKRQLESLTWAGAFDSLSENREQAYTALDIILRLANSRQNADNDQTSLFEVGLEAEEKSIDLPDVERLSPSELLNREFDSIGFWLSAHPLEVYSSSLKRLGARPSLELLEATNRSEQRWRLAGMVQRVQERRSARGNRYAFVLLSDPTGPFEVSVFSDLLNSTRTLLEPGRALLVEAEVRVDNDNSRLVATAIRDLELAASRFASRLLIQLDSTDKLNLLKNILDRSGPGHSKIRVAVSLDRDQSVYIALPGQFTISPETRETISEMTGYDCVEDA